MANTMVWMLAAGAGTPGAGGEAGSYFQLFLVRVQLPRKLGGRGNGLAFFKTESDEHSSLQLGSCFSSFGPNRTLRCGSRRLFGFGYLGSGSRFALDFGGVFSRSADADCGLGRRRSQQAAHGEQGVEVSFHSRREKSEGNPADGSQAEEPGQVIWLR